ncbi:MAG: AtpZ/AtpI family protein [Lutibacter sp.]|nr:AtpZ/AtpI family protein [Lutibacter sp.]
MDKPNKKKQLNKYLQLTGIAFQMGITIYLGAYFGKKLDAHYQNSTRTFTIILTLVALLISIWSVLSQLKNINEKND